MLPSPSIPFDRQRHKKMFRRNRSRARRLIAAACAAGGLFSLAPVLYHPSRATTAAARPAQTGGGNVAIVTPLLNILTAGTSVGMPEGCNVALGVVASGSRQLGLSAPAGPVISAISTMCANASNQGAAGWQNLNDRLASLAVINPAADQFINEFAAVLNVVASMGPALGPFGPDVAALPPFGEFFKSH